MSFQKIAKNLEDYLRYEQEEGRLTVEVSGSQAGVPPGSPAVKGVSCSPVPLSTSFPSPAAEIDATADPASRRLADIAARVAACKLCSLHRERTRTVPGQGNSTPDIMFVGEGPGADEDRQGLAFVGRAGQLLTRMIEAMGYAREQVFIGNIVKCRPPENRTPMPDEMDACLPFLKEQIAILHPKVVVALGATAVRGLLNVSAGIMKLRGNWMLFEGIDVMPTLHPAYLLRNPPAKKEAWEDLKAVLRRLGREPPVRAQ